MCKDNQPKRHDRWLKSKEVREILHCSPGTLNSLKSKLKWSKVSGTIYWSYNSIQELLEKNSYN
jgi:hypothetical protein